MHCGRFSDAGLTVSTGIVARRANRPYGLDDSRGAGRKPSSTAQSRQSLIVGGRVAAGMEKGRPQGRPFSQSWRKDLNLRPPGPKPGALCSPDIVESTLTTGDTPACTTACTSEAKNTHPPAIAPQGQGLDSLAKAIANLTAEDRVKLAAMLAQSDTTKGGRQ